MKALVPTILWGFLDRLSSSCLEPKANFVATTQKTKSFAQAVTNSAHVSVSHLPQPCLKRDAIAIKIIEVDYQAGLQRCKSHLHGRLVLAKGDKPLKFVELKEKLTSLWSKIGKWSIISLGKGFYDFSFSLPEDMRTGELVYRYPWMRVQAIEPAAILLERLPKQKSEAKALEAHKNGARKQPLVEVVPQIPVNNDLFINLEIDDRNNNDLHGLERVEICSESNSSIHLEEDLIVPASVPIMNDHDNTVVANDLRLVGRLWDDDSLDEEWEEESFTNVLSKSQKKRLKKKNNIENSYNTLSSTFWNSLNLDLFVVSNRGDVLPNLWGLCSRAIPAFPGPWCFIGDFNAVVGANKCRSSRVLARIPSEEFKVFIENANLLHLPTRGASFTWSNRRTGSALTEKRLDRSLCNETWLNLWSQVSWQTLPRSSYDHHPLLFSAYPGSPPLFTPFKFQKMWLLHLDRRRVISEAWRANFSSGPMYILSHKLKLLKKDLRTWNKRVFGNIHHKFNNALSNVDLIQTYIVDIGPNPELLEQEDQAQKALFHDLGIEEVFWKEKYRINCHIHGDINTKFFHRVTKIRQATKAMSILMDDEKILYNQDDIANHVLNYYTDLFGSTNNIARNDLIQSVIPSLVFDDENLMLTSILSHQEIKDVVCGLNGDGAPGPDDFVGCFYQAFWDIVGNDVCCSVTQFFTQGWILPNMNSNSVILISKNNNAVKIDDYRPIAIANFKFKIITKVLADRLSIIAFKIISSQQRGFIRDRKTQECICLASEAINLLDHKTFGGNMAIKLDIKKPFDIIDWDFITSTLTEFGFSVHFTNLIKVILSSARLSFCVNGHMVGFTNCSRGVRQGDPLSPLLLCIAEDVFSRGIMKLVNDRKLSPIFGPNMLHSPNHFLYADDIMVFCKGTKSNLLAMKSLIQNYSSASGQHISVDKCQFYIKNAPARKLSNIFNYLGFRQGSLPFNYLGVPLFTGKPKKCHLQPIADKILLKLSTWKSSLLSIMGRVELVKSICQSMLVYSFHVYKWLAQLLKWVDSKMRNFIWSSNTEVRKIVNVAWNQVCSSTSFGRLGLKSIKLMNKSALLKLAWDMLSSQQEWASFYRERFCCNRIVPPRYHKSFIWPGIKDNWSMVVMNSRWLVGDGRNINFWTDNWLGETLVDALHIPTHLYTSLKAKVADFISGFNWVIPLSLLLRFPEIISKTKDIPIANSRDRFIWQNSSDGILIAKLAYDSLTHSNSPNHWRNNIWFNSIPPSKSFITWRLLNGKMPTDDNLQKRGCYMGSMCCLCRSNTEGSSHLFLTCPFAIYLWNWLGSHLAISIDTSFVTTLFSICNNSWSKQMNEMLSVCIIYTIHTIWLCRNKNRFEDKMIYLAQAISRIKREVNLSDTLSSATGKNSLHEFCMFKALNLSVRPCKSPSITEVIWLPPTQNWIKINTDGATHGSPGYSGGGGIFRDHHGNFLGAFATFLGIHYVIFADFSAALISIDLVVKQG
ncbi:PREDICTED: uncharacterized protein LOC109338759 [Lupinus angustifolius]|uniref:uncharacterized protein LOC109338759 n=1 Tax=Lupinus angustifolius TaxID=3871 RepID=UPI00092E52C1|nr:PREDICTED: uncharacterized protein LOC109338759 [Lupinus angustifolius]